MGKWDSLYSCIYDSFFIINRIMRNVFARMFPAVRSAGLTDAMNVLRLKTVQ